MIPSRDRRRPAGHGPETIIISQPIRQSRPEPVHRHRPRSRSRSPSPIRIQPVYTPSPDPRFEGPGRPSQSGYQRRRRSRSRSRSPSPIRIQPVYAPSPDPRIEGHGRPSYSGYQRRHRSRSPPVVIIHQPPTYESSSRASIPPPPLFYAAPSRSSSYSGHGHYNSRSSYGHGVQQPTIIVNEDPYVPVDPFQLRPQQVGDMEGEVQHGVEEVKTSVCLPFPISCCSPESCFACATWMSDLFLFFIEDLPRQVYLYLLLRIPSLYFSRVTRVFEDAELSMPDIKRMVNREENDVLHANWPSHYRHQSYMSPALLRFKGSWEDFIVSLSTEWQTQNIIAVLLLSAVLTLLQIDSIGDDPLSRTAAILALLCALMSLLYGCVYMVRFGTMNKMYKAASWAVEAQRTRTFIFWNVWVFLSMPTVWLSWSLILFITCIMSFVWRTTTSSDLSGPPTLTHRQILGLRIAISAILGLGFLYFLLIMKTLKHYGTDMDKEWKDRAMLWRRERRHSHRVLRVRDPSDSDSSYPRFVDDPTSRGYPPIVFLPNNNDKVLPQLDFKPMKILDLDTLAEQFTPMPWILCQQDVIEENWYAFIQNVAMAWHGVLDVPSVGVHQRLQRRQEIVADVVGNWNNFFFLRRGVKMLYSDDVNFRREREFFSQLNSMGASVLPHSLYMMSLPVEYDSVYASYIGPYDPPRKGRQDRNAIAVNSRGPRSPSTLSAPTVPGPYSAALQQAQTTPAAFSRRITTFDNSASVETGKILDLAYPVINIPVPLFLAARSVVPEDWDRFVFDLTYGWYSRIPVPNLTHSDCMAIRPTILADLITTWNARFFHSRGVEAFLTDRGTGVFDDGSPFYTPSVLHFRSFDPTGPEGINGRYMPSGFRSVSSSGRSTPSTPAIYTGGGSDRPPKAETSRAESERKPGSSRGTFNQRARGRLLRKQREMSS